MTNLKGDIKNLGLASLGAVLEYFDFVVYVYVAAALSQAFFPPGASVWLRQIQVFGIYAIGYLIRPVAGVIIAHYADRIGRKRLFIFTVLLMSVPTFLMGLLPTYAQIGWLAPLALLILRVLQGCAVGGELPGASVFVAQHTPAGRLGIASGFFIGIVNCGLLLGAGAAALSSAIASLDPSLSALAFRLPFILGGIFGLMAAYLRRQLEETPLFLKIKQEKRLSKQVPLKVVVGTYWRSCLFALAIVFVMSVTSGVYFQYLQTYLISEMKFTPSLVFTANVVGVLVFVISMPLWGRVSDALGWGKTIGIGTVLGAIVCVWFFNVVRTLGSTDPMLVYAFIPVGLVGGFMHAQVPGLIASLFPTSIRQSGFALPYSIGTAFFTGLTPLALAWLVRGYGLMAPRDAYLLACAVAAATAGGGG